MRPLGTAQPKPIKGTAKKARRTKRAGRGKAFRQAVWDASDGTCVDCSRRVIRTLDFDLPNAGHVAHVVPKSVAPERAFDTTNGVIKCSRCHLGNDHGMKF